MQIWPHVWKIYGRIDVSDPAYTCKFTNPEVSAVYLQLSTDDPAVQQQIEHIEFGDDPSGTGERVIYITMAGDAAEAGAEGQCVEYVTTEVDGEFASALGLAAGQTTLPVQVANADEEGAIIVKVSVFLWVFFFFGWDNM